jgi:hypothetical protein
MKTYFSIFSGVVLACLLTLVNANASDGEKIVIALEADDFTLAQTDISQLEIGESETIMTESGKIVDLLRTSEGVEIYIDGELLDMPHMRGSHAHDGEHSMIHKEIVLECEFEDDAEGSECGNHEVWVSGGDDLDFHELHEYGEEHQVIRIYKSHDTDFGMEGETKKAIIIEKG